MTSFDDDRDNQIAERARRFEAIAPAYGYLVRRVLQEQSEGERLTIPQFRTMQTLGQHGVPGATNLDLARRISVSPPAMTAMIDGLVERDLVTRTTDPDNRRQVVILLTELGRERLHAATRAIEERLALGISHLSEDQVLDLDRGLAALELAFGYLLDASEV
jgi:DNA-binding MarR family transcriptional regulator